MSFDKEKDQRRRDRNFRKLCQWFDETAEIADILVEECGQIKNCQWKKPDSSPEEIGVSHALEMLNFLSALAQCPQDYEGAAEEQAEFYPELARGLMLIAICVGQMRQNEQSASFF